MGSVWKLLLECGFQSWSSVLRAMLIKILDTQVPLKHQLKDLVEYKSISAEYKNQSSELSA